MLTKITDGFWVDLSKLIYFGSFKQEENGDCAKYIIQGDGHTTIYINDLEHLEFFEAALEKYYNPPEKNTFQTIPYNLGD